MQGRQSLAGSKNFQSIHVKVLDGAGQAGAKSKRQKNFYAAGRTLILLR